MPDDMLFELKEVRDRLLALREQTQTKLVEVEAHEEATDTWPTHSHHLVAMRDQIIRAYYGIDGAIDHLKWYEESLR